MTQVDFSYSLMFSTINLLCCARTDKRPRSDVLSENDGALLVSRHIEHFNGTNMSLRNTSIAEATGISAFAETEPCMYLKPQEPCSQNLKSMEPVLYERHFSVPSTGARVGRVTTLRKRALKLGSRGIGISRTLSVSELKMVMSQSLEQIPGSMAKLKHVQTRESVWFAEKPDAHMVKAARARLRSTQIEQKICLPTLADIRAEKMARERSQQILKQARNRLRHVTRCSQTGIFMERPDVSMIQAAHKRLKSTKVKYKMYLPTADDIRAERAAAESLAQARRPVMPEGEIQEVRRKLRPVRTTVRAWNPTAEELAANRADRERHQAAHCPA